MLVTTNEMTSAEVRSKVDRLIATTKVVVISKSHCPYSRRAKIVLKNYAFDSYYAWEIDDEPQMSEIQWYMHELTGESSVPRVFIDGKFVGGGNDIVRLDKNGELAKLLA